MDRRILRHALNPNRHSTLPQKRHFRNIIVCTDPGRLHGSSLLRGVMRYAKLHDWAVHCVGDNYVVAEEIAKWRFDGGLGLLYGDALNAVEDLGLPYVSIRRNETEYHFPSVLLDDLECGEVAANHLLDRGFVHFAYGGDLKAPYGRMRYEGFKRTLEKSGRCISLEKWQPDTISDAYSACCFYGHDPNDYDLDWLRNSPRPLGVFLMFDPLALSLASLCRVTDVRVPEEVAILGVHDAEVTCNMSVPTLSSVASPAEQMGFLAAQVLDRQMTHPEESVPRIELPPLGVTERQSTAITLHEDELVNRALIHIQNKVTSRLSVQQLADHLSISRRHLERQFRTVLRRTPLEEIHRVRLRHALELLSRKPEMTISQVALASGYSRNNQLAAAVREYTGRTPSQYRKLFIIDPHSLR